MGQHRRLQLTSGRPSELYRGDRVVVACGARYAPDQFEAEAVIDHAACHLVAGGGIAGRAVAAHTKMAPPTALKPLGRLARQDGTPVNLRDYAIAPPSTMRRPVVLAVAGSSMNAGKTTTAASLAHGLTRAGLPVGAAKLTGTGAFGDYNAFLDAGVREVLDFTDAGYASTFGVALNDLESVCEVLVGELGARGCKVAVVELADGVFQAETADLLRSPRLRQLCHGVVFAAADALGAAMGALTLERCGVRTLALSGRMTAAPLATEEARRETGLPCFNREDLCDPGRALEVLDRALGACSQIVSADATLADPASGHSNAAMGGGGPLVPAAAPGQAWHPDAALALAAAANASGPAATAA